MAFELKSVVPWGRNLEEYKKMFRLTEVDLKKRIAGFGDGPASFNAEMQLLGGSVVSFDPIYVFSGAELAERIEESRDEVIAQTRQNMGNFVWKHIKDISALEQIRMQAMRLFLADFEAGKAAGRYRAHALPEQTPCRPLSFDLGLSSHFLMLYDGLGLDFHIRSILEMLRICREIRVFPLVNLNIQKPQVLDSILAYFDASWIVEVLPVDYEFQKGGNKMLIIRHPVS